MSSFVTSLGQLRHQYICLAEMCSLVPELFAPHEVDLGGQPAPDVTSLVVDKLKVGRSEVLLDGVSFSVKAGETLLITGQSGRGKTTLLMTLIGIVERLGGDIQWSGTPLDAINPASLRRRCSYAGPEPYLIPGTIAENLAFGGGGGEDISNDDMRRALWCASAEFVDEFEDGTAHQLNENGDGISAGQKQRLSLARSLLRQPDVLLLDEATANIDEDTERRIMERLRTTFPDVIVIAVAHRASMRQFATTIIEL